MSEEQIKINGDGTVTLSCKIPAQWYPLLRAICSTKGATLNALVKQCIEFIIESARIQTEPSSDMKVLLHMLHVDSNWQAMFRFIESAKLDIAQLILITQQAKDGNPREGFGLAMFDKPFCGDIKQTLCVDEIVERVLEVAMGQEDYWDMRAIAQHFEATSIRESLIRMVDAQAIINLDDADREELPGMGTYHSNGRQVAYDMRTKRKKHFTPDTAPAIQMPIVFDDYDATTHDLSTEDWEGEHRQHESPPESMNDND